MFIAPPRGLLLPLQVFKLAWESQADTEGCRGRARTSQLRRIVAFCGGVDFEGLFGIYDIGGSARSAGLRTRSRYDFGRGKR